ncbi:hypothetical protein BKA70DRAFT_1100771 [Coprinopsis sp. MPI-PUGE-AT-0042]|nr:hypothetical protein BKA70DRAFT_1100771 [Coprinopsis sp. MPI-PUGE-AT-0042]
MRRWSSLEKMVLSITLNDLRFLDQFFYHWPIRELVRLGQTNLTLYCVVRGYLDKAWNVRSLLRRWFGDVERLLTMMRHSSTILHGLTVLRFFHRAVDEKQAVELCTPISHVYQAVTVLDLEQYVFQPRDRFHPCTFDQALRQAVEGRPEAMHALAAERSTDPATHLALRFDFARTRVLPNGAVRMHWIHLNVVTFEPHRFLLSRHSTAFTAYIGSEAAICPFAFSTFVTRRTFTLLESDHNNGNAEEYCLMANGVEIQRFTAVSGGHRVYNEVEIGRRFLGDPHCLVLPIDTEPLVLQDRCLVRGPCFEVFDFASTRLISGAYLGIREPSITGYVQHTDIFDNSLKFPLFRLMIAAQTKHLAPGLSFEILTLQYLFPSMTLFVAAPEQTDRLNNCKLLLQVNHASLQRTTGVKAILFATGVKHPVITDLPTLSNRPLEDSIVMGDFFPHGSISIRLLDVAGLGFPVGCSFRLYNDNLREVTPMNPAIFHVFGIPWAGNLVLVRYGGPEASGHTKEDSLKFQHCAKSDMFIACLLLALWLREMVTIGLYDDVQIHPDDPAKHLFQYFQAHNQLESSGILG